MPRKMAFNWLALTLGSLTIRRIERHSTIVAQLSKLKASLRKRKCPAKWLTIGQLSPSARLRFGESSDTTLFPTETKDKPQTWPTSVRQRSFR